MRVRKNLLLSIGVSLLVIWVFLSLSSRWILLASFASLEEREVQAALQRVEHEFAETQTDLDTIVAEYASWDDTYAFAAGAPSQYLQSNFSGATFQNLRLNLVLLADPAGKILYGSGYDLEAGQPTAVPAGLAAQLALIEQRANSLAGNVHVSGILLLPEGPLAIAARPILTSDEQGPSRGVLIVGRTLSTVELDQLARDANVTWTVHRVDDAQLPADFNALQASTYSAEVRPLSAATVAGYDRVADLFGRPALLFRVDLPRVIYQQGQRVLDYFMGWFGAFELLAGVIIYFVRDRLEVSRQARQSAEARYQSIFENAPDGIFQSSPEGRILHANPALAHTFGYASPAALIRAVTNIADQLYADPPARARFTERLQAEGRISHFEANCKRQDGTPLWASISARLVRDAAGRPLHYEGFLQDITERRSAEEHLRESEQRFRAIVEQSSDGVALLDESGQIIEWNQANERLTGWSRRDVVGRPYWEVSQGFLAPELRTEQFLKHLKTSVEAALQTGESYLFDRPVERQFTAPNGLGQRVIQQVFFPIRTQRGFHLASITRDVTERQRAEAALTNREKRFRALVENGLDNISLLTADGTLLWESPAVVRTLDYAPDEFVGQNLMTLVHPDDLAWVRASLAELMTEPGRRGRATFRLRHRDGDWRWIEAVVTNLLAEPSVAAVVINYRDVTERRRAEEALSESETKFRSIIEQASEGIALADEAGLLIEWNRTNEIISGLDRAAVVGRPFWEVAFRMTPPEQQTQLEQARLEAEVRQALATGHSPLFERASEGQLTAPDGQIRYFQQTLFPIQTKTGFRLGSVTRDITERQKIEDALRASEQKFRSLVEQSSEGVVLIDEAGRIIEWNSAEEHITGLPRAQALGAYFWDVQYQIVTPEHRARLTPAFLRQAFFESLHTGRAMFFQQAIEVDIMAITGQRKTVLQTSFLIKTEAGNRVGAIVLDITARRQAEEALRASEAKFRSYVEYAPLGVFVIDPAGHFLEANPATRRLFGYTEAELSQQAIFDVLPAQTEGLSERFFDAVLRQGRIAAELSVRRQDGEVVWIAAQAVPLGQGQVLAFCQDISARRQSEEQLRATLEEKETLLREVHHRVKNNLQATIALLHLHGQNVPEAGTQQFLKELEGQVRSMSLVYEQLYQSKNLARVVMATYLQQLVNNILESFGNGRAIQVALDAPLSLDVEQAMPCGLIINELLTNALKHAFPARGAEAAPPTIHVQLREEGAHYHLRVRDNGVGLPPGGAWRSSKTLGLQLVQLWATHQLGGTLTVQNTPGADFAVDFTTAN